MSKYVCIFLLCVYSVSPVSVWSDQRDEVTSSAELSQLNDFFHEPFKEALGYSMVLGNAKERILSRFGKPASQESTRYPARTSDELLWNTTLEYAGMTIAIGEAADRTRSWLESIDITSNEYLLKFGLHIGSSRGDLLNVFSDSSHLEHDDKLRYGAVIWESRTDTKHFPGEDVTVTTGMELTVTIDANDRIGRILIESIEL